MNMFFGFMVLFFVDVVEAGPVIVTKLGALLFSVEGNSIKNKKFMSILLRTINIMYICTTKTWTLKRFGRRGFIYQYTQLKV